MPLNPGTTLCPYAVTAKIGEGGKARCIGRETPNSTGTWR